MNFPTTIVFGTGSDDPSGNVGGKKAKGKKAGKKKAAAKKK